MASGRYNLPLATCTLSLSMDLEKEVLRAALRLKGNVRQTRLEHSPYFSQLIGGNVYFKLENLQVTGSFKARGAMNKLLSLSPEQRPLGAVAASSGNHGAAVSYGLNRLGMAGTVFVPEIASPVKVDAIRSYGADVGFHGHDSGVTEIFARQYAADNDMVYVSPYNDPLVVAGQGTIGLEIANELDSVDAVFVSLGGGGLISGIAGYLKAVQPDVQMIACSPDHSKVMAKSVAAGEILDLESLPTLSDGTAGGVEPGAITFDLCSQLLDAFPIVSEVEIASAMRLFMEKHHMLIEGAAGVAIAAFLQRMEQLKGKTAVIVICGANIGLDTLKSVL
ncbi:MAG: threonine/serine dehydratase [Chloroflexota bacterium]